LALGERHNSKKLLPLIAIPTTAGTGSEATHFAVVYVDGVKYSLAATELLPDIAIVDPDLVDTLPRHLAACSGFDALCQGIESYWALGATPQSREYAAEAVRMIVGSIVESVNEANEHNRSEMMCAANLAGKAINISKTTAPHALSYKITAMTGLPHGHAVAMTLGHFFEINESYLGSSEWDSDGSLSYVLNSVYELLGVDGASSALGYWKDLMEKCGLESDVARVGVDSRERTLEVVGSVNVERLRNHPVPVSFEDLVGVFDRQ
jgi:alcohol dehydrogenase class IV